MKKILFSVIILVISAMFVLIGLELFFRLNPKFNYKFSSLKFKHDHVLSLDNDNFKYIRPSALLGYEIIPDANNGLPVSANSYGLIGKEYRLSKDKNTFRILLLGDSIAWQDCSRQFIEEELNRAPSLNSKYKFEIWNAGCPSYDVRRYYLYLKHRGLNYKPDMVVIFFCLNDFTVNINIYYKDKKGATEYYFPILEISKRIYISPFFMKHSYFYRFVILMLDSYVSSQKKNHNDVLRENGKYYLLKIKDICTSNNIPLVAVIFPYLKPLSAYDNYQQREYQAIVRVVKESGLNSINLNDYLANFDLYDLRNREDDFIHPNPKGHRLIGQIIYNYLLDNFLSLKKVH